jgi:hypothetical protein
LDKTQKEIIDDFLQLSRELLEDEKNGLDFLLVRRIPHNLLVDFVQFVVKPRSKREVATSEVFDALIGLMQTRAR